MIVTQGNVVEKSGIPNQGSEGLMISNVIVHIRVDHNHVDTSEKTIRDFYYAKSLKSV